MGLLHHDTQKKIKRSGRYLSLAFFQAYNQEHSEFWYDDDKPQKEQIELRCIDICHAVTIHEVQIIDLKNAEVEK